jgi:hypothetical protein
MKARERCVDAAMVSSSVILQLSGADRKMSRLILLHILIIDVCGLTAQVSSYF